MRCSGCSAAKCALSAWFCCETRLHRQVALLLAGAWAPFFGLPGGGGGGGGGGRVGIWQDYSATALANSGGRAVCMYMCIFHGSMLTTPVVSFSLHSACADISSHVTCRVSFTSFWRSQAYIGFLGRLCQPVRARLRDSQCSQSSSC